MLLLFILSSVLQIGAACQKIPLYFGTLDPALAIPGGTKTGVISSCQCCAFCHHDQRCKSFSFYPSTGQCTMYSKVGGYPTFHRQQYGAEDAEFYMMPRRSTTDEFCREDDDCLTGEPCMAKVCTTNKTITCLTIKELNPTVQTHTFWGAVDGTEIRLNCMMSRRGGGWTMLVDSPFNHAWGQEEVDSLNSIGDGPVQKMGQTYSALWAADPIRDSRPGNYEVMVRSLPTDKGVRFTVPRAQTLLGTTPVKVPYTAEPSGSDFSFGTGSVVFPYKMNQHGVVYHMNEDQGVDIGGIMRTFQTINVRWAAGSLRPHTIQIWMKEGQ